MSLWRKKKNEEKPKFKSGGIVPIVPPVNVTVNTPEVFTEVSPAVLQLLSKKTVLDKLGLPSFEGIGDTMGFDGPDGGVRLMECVWCGGYGTHKPDCKALSRNWSRSSLGVQREMTDRLRAEIDQRVERTYYQGSGAWASGGTVTKTPEPPDTRTDLQKRFDAIAEELEETKK